MNTDTTIPPFESWAVVEVFGHQTFAGFVTQMTLGSAVMWRIDVPAVEQDGKTTQAFTKIFGVAAIFSMTPCSEEIARGMIRTWQAHSKPLHVFALEAPRKEPDIFDRIDDELAREAAAVEAAGLPPLADLDDDDSDVPL